MKVLGVETSCDETAVAIYDSEAGLLGHLVHSQIELHRRYGGVVPELASRDHVRKVIPMVEQLLQQLSISRNELDGIAYTAGPGLMGALLVGSTVARGLAFSLNIPTVAVHHMEGHLLAPMMTDDRLKPPFIALLVSGGHTQLVQVSELGVYQILGDTLDDAVGEAFDKTAVLLGLPYPGGPQVSSLAEKGREDVFTFPRPMVNRPGLDFSFSGLKTAVRNEVMKLENGGTDQQRADVARAFEKAVVDTLLIKCRRAVKETRLKQLVVSGGVSANRPLRQKLTEMMAKQQGEAWFPDMEFCGDNGAMIAYVGCLRLLSKNSDDNADVQVRARWPLDQLSAIG